MNEINTLLCSVGLLTTNFFNSYETDIAGELQLELIFKIPIV